MISAFFEGITQSLLPCSWTLLLPAIALGMATRRATVITFYIAGVVATVWIAASGALTAPLWLAGLSLLGGAAAWWRTGPNWIASLLVGIGAGWAWRPCVGTELGNALTTALTDPWAAFLPLAFFLVGVTGVGLLIGAAIGRLVGESRKPAANRAGSLVASILGLTMVLGVYSSIASVLARWSTELWA